MVIRKHDNDEPKFTMCPNALIRHLSPIGLKTYLAAKSFDWTGNGAFPGQKKIAERAGSSDRTVRRGLDELLKTGAIIREPRRRSYLYRFPPIADDWKPAGLSGLSASEPADLSGQTGGSVRCEPADLSSEVNKGKKTQGNQTTEAGPPSVAPADAGTAYAPGSQGLGEAGPTAAPLETAGSTAGPGSTDGPPLATDGPGSTTGSAGQTAGQHPGQSNDLGAANSKKHWSSRVAESKGQRAKRPFDDPDMESRASLIADCAIENRIDKSSREATMTTARHLLMDGKEHDEILAVIRHAGASPDRWKVTNLWKLRDRHYDDILADLRASTERTPEEWATLRAKIDAYSAGRAWQDTEPNTDADDAGAVATLGEPSLDPVKLDDHDEPSPPSPKPPIETWVTKRARENAEKVRLAREAKGHFTRSPALSSEGSLSATLIPVVRPA